MYTSYLKIFASLLWISWAWIAILAAQMTTLPAQLYGVEEGLPDPRVRCLLQDKKGFLWIGTENGLSCFDGRIFQNYFSHQGSDRLSGNFISSLLEDRDGIIWIATLDGGLTRWDPEAAIGKRSRIFYHVPDEPASLPVNRLHSLFDFDADYLMLSGEQASVFFLDKKSFAFRVWKGDLPLHPSHAQIGAKAGIGWVHCMLGIDSSRLILSFLHNRQIWGIDLKSGQKIASLSPQVFSADEQTFSSLAWDDSYLYGAGWQQGIRRWSRQDLSLTEKIEIPDEVESLLTLAGGKLLAGSRSKGLFEIQTASGQVSRLQLLLPSGELLQAQRLICIIRDKEGACWLGSNQGLICIFPDKPEGKRGLLAPIDAGKKIFKLAFSPEGKALIFSSEGLYMEDSSGFSLRSFSYQNHKLEVTAFYPRSASEWYLGTENGMFYYHLASGKIEPFPALIITGAKEGAAFDFLQIRDIFEDSVQGKPQLILGILGYGLGLIDLPRTRLQFFLRLVDCDSCIQSNMIRKILPDGRGNYWVASSQGLYLWNPQAKIPEKAFISYFGNPGQSGFLSSDDILDIALDGANALWIASRKGLNVLREGKIESYFLPETNNPALHAIIPINAGELLLANNSGTVLFNKKEKRFSHFWGKEILGIWEKGAITGKNEALLVGTNSWCRIQLDSLKRSPQAPRPYIVNIAINGQAQSAQAVAEMAYHDYINIQLSTLHLHHAAAFHIQYRWESGIEQWQPAPSDGILRVSNLRQGRHVLWLRVEDGNGNAFHEGSFLLVQVKPPFWLSWPFLLFTGLFFLGIILAFQQFRFRQQQKQHAIRLGIAGDLHDEVGSALGSILMGSELASKLVEQDDAKSKMIMENIRSIASQTLQNMTDIIWAIQPQHDSGEKLSIKMQQVGNELLVPKEIRVNYRFAPALEHISLSMPARKNLMLIYKEALHNIAKHAEASEVLLVLEVRHRQLILQVQDNGKGFFRGDQSGNGPDSMQRRAKSLSGNLEIQSTKGQGTLVRLELPLANIKA